MPIFEEYGGPTRERGYYSAADWAKLQNPDWAKSQEEYDAFAAQAAARAANNAAAMSRAREAIPYSYTQFGQGSTEPVFSLSGFAGQSGGGTAGLAGFAGTGGPTGTTVIGDGSTSTTDGGTTDGGSSNPRNNVPRTDGGGQDDSSNPRGDVYQKAEGGVILPDLYMAQGGVIGSPYANSILPPPTKTPMQAMSATPPTMQGGPPGIGGLFEQLYSQSSPQMGMNQSSPLSAYRGYLQETYVNPQAQDMANKVSEFVDLVSNAERAHFGAQDQMGPMGQMQMQPQMNPQMQQQMQQQMHSETPMLGGEPMRSWSMPLSLSAPSGGLASLQSAQQSAMGG